MIRNLIKYVSIVVCFCASEAFAQPAPLDYFRTGHVGNYWKYYVVFDVAHPESNRWSLIEVVGDTIFGVPEETRSFRTEYWEDWEDTPPSEPWDHNYRTVYYTVNDNRDLCLSAAWDADNDSAMVFDPMWTYLKNPVEVGDFTFFGDSAGWGFAAIVESVNDTINLPIGSFQNCLKIYEVSLNNGQPLEATYSYYAPYPIYGIVKTEGYHWYSYPDSFRYGYSYLKAYDVNPDLSRATLVQDYSTAFSAAGITLTWTLSEIDEGIEFIIERAGEPNGPFIELPSREVNRDGLVFTFVDRDCESGATYFYRVDVRRGAERWTLFDAGPVATPAMPLALYQNQPNPFNPSSTISYYLPEDATVSLDVYDLSGRKVVNLMSKIDKKGPHSVAWNGRDAEGKLVASGVYFYRLQAGKQAISRKMVLLR
jgi:hypothetical protein